MPRKSEYNPKFHDHVAWALAVEGKTDEQIAKVFGISERTITQWKHRHSSLVEALKQGKAEADAKVTRTLYQRAVGTTVKTKRVIVEMDKEGNQKPAKIETTEQEIAGDVTAQIFWLKNRKPDLWREKKDINVNTFEQLLQTLPEE